MSQKLPKSSFEWVEDASQSNKDFIKSHYEEKDERYFKRLISNILKNNMTFKMASHFYLKEWRLKKS